MIQGSSKRGLLICLEGLDHSGKTTQCKNLQDWFQANGQKSELLRFPGKDKFHFSNILESLIKYLSFFSSFKTKERSTALGKTIDAYLKGKESISDEVIHMLFATNRWEFK